MIHPRRSQLRILRNLKIKFLKYLFKIDDNEISKLEIPTGNPLLLKFEKKNIKEAKYLDQSRSRDLIKF